MIPVLALEAPARGCEMLCDVFGFQDLGAGRLRYGDLTIAVCDVAQLPDALIDIRMDHLALRVPDVAPLVADLPATWAANTPDGPRDIAEFWGTGVRFMFFEGPEGWPIEFCMRLDGSVTDHGLDHFGIRVAKVGALADHLTGLGADLVAQHQLGAVEVRFLQRAGQMFELFDEAPVLSPQSRNGWCGFLPTV